MARHASAGEHKPDARKHLKRIAEQVRRAFAELLTIPTLLIAGFLALSALAYYLDQMRVANDWPAPVTGSHESVSTLLGTIAASIITVTSITFSLLLIAVQQSAAALTGQVYDQFLRRRANQAYFGFFIGLALYCLVILATVREGYTPIYGAAIAFVLVVVALFMLILLIYASIDQMRPVAIIGNIRDHTLSARKRQRGVLAATRQSPGADPAQATRLAALESGFVTAIDAARLAKTAKECGAATEIVLLRCLGDYVSVGEDLIEVRDGGGATDDATRERLLAAVRLERKRDLGTDPGFGIEQMTNIAWTTVSTSKQNPEPGKLVCRALRDLVAHWYGDSGDRVERGGGECRVVARDRVPRDLVRAFETLAVVASESMQHHVLAEVYRALALALARLDEPLRSEVEQLILRSLSMLADHVLTAELDESIAALLDALPPGATRSALQQSRDRLAETHGILNSRASRVKNPLADRRGS